MLPLGIEWLPPGLQTEQQGGAAAAEETSGLARRQ